MGQRDFASVVVILQIKLLGFCPLDELPEQDLTSAVLVWKKWRENGIWESTTEHGTPSIVYLCNKRIRVLLSFPKLRENYTAKPQYRKFETNIPRIGIARPQSQFPHLLVCVCERFIYSHDRSTYSAAGKYMDRSWEYIKRSQTHEWGNWDWGRAISFLGIHKWDFLCSVGEEDRSRKENILE